MFNETNAPGPEYRVRPVVRYVVTKYCHPYTHVGDGSTAPIDVSGGSKAVGEFPNEQQAFEVANALANVECKPSTVSV